MKKYAMVAMFLILAFFYADKVMAQETAIIYYNQACSDCLLYAKEITPILNKYNIDVSLKDYINDPKYRAELNTETKRYNVPIKLQDSLTIFLKSNLVIEGHIPQNIVENLVKDYDKFPNHKLIVLYQPEMHAKVKEISVYVSGYETEKISIDTDFVGFLRNKEVKALISTPSQNILVPIVAGAISNSLHPCSIAVLLLLLTFLYSIKKKKKDIVLIGLAYITGIFIVYFLIGLGLLRAISLSDQPFFVAKTASILLIILGVINIKDYFFPKLPIHLKIPDFTKGAIQKFMEKASIPTAFIVGALVGLCAFPCTGGIYTVIISTLAVTKSAQFVLYLVLYNLIFVFPLLLVVFISANQTLLEKIEVIELSNARKLHLVTGILMVLIGIAVYLWIGVIIYG